MKINIALASAVSVGDTIVCKIKKNEWYCGLVVRKTNKLLSLEFYDGSSAAVREEDFKHIRVVLNTKRKIKKALTDLEAKALYEKLKKLPAQTKYVPQAGDEKLELLPSQQVQSVMNGTPLARYLNGVGVNDSWIKAVSKRRSTIQPKILYRLCVLGANTAVGDKVTLTKFVISASDFEQNAIYGGCSYLDNFQKKIDGKILALVELKKPRCCLSYAEIDSILSESGSGQQLYVLQHEREYIVSGPVSGTVIQIVDSDVLLKRRYLKMVKIK